MEQLAAQSSQRRLRDDSSTRAASRRRLTLQRNAEGMAAGAARDSLARRAARVFIVGTLLLTFASHMFAQSGRRRAEPSASPEPNAQRPRRATPARPADNIPGQPATPDAPGANTATPTPETSTPRPQSNEPAAPATTTAGDDSAVEIDDGEIVRVTSNLVPVSATVTDTRGKAVTDLTVDDFELRIDGQPKPIGGLSHAETPVRMVMLFDNSDSIRASREFEKQAAMRFFKSVLRPVDQAAIYSVGTVFDLVQPLTNDVDKLVRTIDHFDKPEGATKLIDAMAHAAEYLRLMPGRKVLVVVSDGADTVSDLSFDDVLRRILAADCQVYAVQTGAFENANLVDLIALRRLETFSERTGGAVYIPKSNGELDAAFAQISADLAQQYVLSYYPTDEGRDNRFRVINLRVKTRPQLRVRARRGYYPRRSAQQISSLPERYSSASGEAEAVSRRSEPPSDLNPPFTMPREFAVKTERSTVTLGAPAHGSKNMDADTSGDPSSARVETDVRVVSPPVKTLEVKAASNVSPQNNEPQNNEPPPGLKPETPDAKPGDSSPPPAATPNEPAPTPAPTPTATQNSNNAPPQPPQQQQQSKQPSPQPAQESVPKTPLNIGQLNSKALSIPKPLYPDMARRMRVEGAVKVLLTVDESGKVISARADGGHALLRESAVNAARLARFTPTLASGQPVAVSGFITYTFKL
ncbi:MAG TPA: VWA domain-containing protein [Pyrinomonadaceae bacterium]|nr:VWA domain-containing protein [Pyrinomonadaceae bacterium]